MIKKLQSVLLTGDEWCVKYLKFTNAFLEFNELRLNNGESPVELQEWMNIKKNEKFSTHEEKAIREYKLYLSYNNRRKATHREEASFEEFQTLVA